MSFVDSLMDMLKNGKEEDGAATARNNLSQTWDYPSLVAALPYRYYDDKNEIFVNAGSAGFIMEAAPLPGANEQVMAALDDMLRKKLPRQTPVTVIMLASKCVGDALNERIYFDQSGVLTRKFGFEHIPARISRDGHVMKVEEIPVSGAKK